MSKYQKNIILGDSQRNWLEQRYGRWTMIAMVHLLTETGSADIPSMCADRVRLSTTLFGVVAVTDQTNNQISAVSTTLKEVKGTRCWEQFECLTTELCNKGCSLSITHTEIITEQFHEKGQFSLLFVILFFFKADYYVIRCILAMSEIIKNLVTGHDRW